VLFDADPFMLHIYAAQLSRDLLSGSHQHLQIDA
jgi:hypothetical protein